jgi:4-amino-4-deoxy-L-arabinose transferase-like glycosyltransferase
MKYKFLLILIFIFACVLRFYHLDSYPALNADEAALGYNAYSLLETGKDEHGNVWPLHFQSFNDYKPGLYVYLVLPFIKIFGLNELTVRFPGALIGALTTVVLYFLVKRISKSQKVSFIASLLLATNPWHLHFSRGAWEVNVATFFIVCGVLFFLQAADNKKYWFASASFFVLSLYTYHAARVVTPLILLSLVLLHIKVTKKFVREVLPSGVFAIVLIIPLVISFFGPAGVSRASGVGLLADKGPDSRAAEQRSEHPEYSAFSVKLLHNKPVNYSLEFLNNWFEHFHGEFLFLSGDQIQRNKVPETGQLYMVEAFSVLIGLLYALRNGKQYKSVVVWLFIAPFAAALTFQSPHALRAHNMVIPLTILSAIGINVIFEVFSKSKALRLASCLVLITVFSWSFTRYLHMYYSHMWKEYPFSSQYGVKELTQYIGQNRDQYEKIYITDRYDQPYILFLFYMQYSPHKFQESHTLTERDVFGFSTVRKFDKYTFTSLKDWGEMADTKGALLIGTPEEIGTGGEVSIDIRGNNDYPYFRVATPK